MRFASLGGSNAGNYAAAGKSVADSAAKMHAVQRKTGPDYTGLSKVAMQTASNEKIAGMQAEAKLTNVAQNVYADQKQNEIKIDVFNKRQEIKASRRKAGGLAAIGKIAGAGFLASRDNTKGREYPTSKDSRGGIMEAHKAKLAEIEGRRTSATDGLTVPSTSAGGDQPGKADGESSASTVSSLSSSAPTNGIRSEAFSYLTKDKGLSRNKALGLIANIDRESGWDPSISSGDDGGPGGLFQWKGSRQTPQVRQLVNSGDWKGQIDYALSEPGERYSQTYQQTTFDSPQAAADGWMTHWERPADTSAGSRKHTNLLGGYGF
tara:strand:+ start:374 stop:1336 length:963 start_codon:yes stop_codon:yes gene_type:complete